jgi:hypothetical protein
MGGKHARSALCWLIHPPTLSIEPLPSFHSGFLPAIVFGYPSSGAIHVEQRVDLSFSSEIGSTRGPSDCHCDGWLWIVRLVWATFFHRSRRIRRLWCSADLWSQPARDGTTRSSFIDRTWEVVANGMHIGRCRVCDRRFAQFVSLLKDR